MAWAADPDVSAAASPSGCASGRRKEREERKARGVVAPVAPHSPGGLHSSPPAPPSLTEGFVLPLCSVPPPLQIPAGSSAPAAPRPPAGPYFLRAGGASEPGAKGLKSFESLVIMQLEFGVEPKYKNEIDFLCLVPGFVLNVVAEDDFWNSLKYTTFHIPVYAMTFLSVATSLQGL